MEWEWQDDMDNKEWLVDLVNSSYLGNNMDSNCNYMVSLDNNSFIINMYFSSNMVDYYMDNSNMGNMDSSFIDYSYINNSFINNSFMDNSFMVNYLCMDSSYYMDNKE